MKTFTHLFDVILTGDKNESRQAARDVRKVLQSSQNDYNERHNDIKAIIENAPFEYSDIEKDWREENFVRAVAVLYFLHGNESQPDFLFPWLFYLLKHKNGNIRHAASNMLENEIGPLTVHIRFPGQKFYDRLLPEKADIILCNLFVGLNNLAVEFWKPAYKKYTYISSLPASPYKTIERVLGILEDDCGELYMKRLKSQLGVK